MSNPMRPTKERIEQIRTQVLEHHPKYGWPRELLAEIDALTDAFTASEAERIEWVRRGERAEERAEALQAENEELRSALSNACEVMGSAAMALKERGAQRFTVAGVRRARAILTRLSAKSKGETK